MQPTAFQAAVYCGEAGRRSQAFQSHIWTDKVNTPHISLMVRLVVSHPYHTAVLFQFRLLFAGYLLPWSYSVKSQSCLANVWRWVYWIETKLGSAVQILVSKMLLRVQEEGGRRKVRMLLRTWEQHRSAMRESWALTSIQRHSPAAGTGCFQSSVPTSCTQAGFSPFLPHQEGGFSFPVYAQHYNFMLLHLLGKHAADARGQQHECPWGDGLWCSHIVSIDFICFNVRPLVVWHYSVPAGHWALSFPHAYNNAHTHLSV